MQDKCNIGDNLSAKDNHLYSVLNVSKAASQSEIDERHRSLVLIFHPDKQRTDDLKEVAAKQFLEIQKAYEVLSDPFLRQVYDTLGSKGLTIKWPSYIRSRSKEEITRLIETQEVALETQTLRKYITSKGKVTCQIDASPLFNTQDERNATLFSKLGERVANVHTISRQMAYSIETKLNEKTVLSVESTAARQQPYKGTFHFLGTIRHQLTPRTLIAASLNPFYPFTTKFEAKYEDSENLVSFNTVSSLLNPVAFPSTSFVFSRKLFHGSPQKGVIILQVSKNPGISFQYVSPPTIEVGESDGLPQQGPPTASGLRYVLFDKTFGLTVDRLLPAVVAEIGISLVELSVRLKCTIQYGLTGIFMSLGGRWSNDTSEVGSSLIFSPSSVVLSIDVGYLEQRLSLPIVLSTEFSPFLMLSGVVLPSTLGLLGYHFIIVPRRRTKRLEYLREMKRNIEEDTDLQKQRNAVKALLNDSVQKQIRLETAREGLIIQEASYGAAAETDDATENMSLDVTVPLQALVRNSQLHIPGGDTKATLQGFSDPAPFIPKTLRIRYLFHGRMHYAEIPDYLPVVLPLAEHQVNVESPSSI